MRVRGEEGGERWGKGGAVVVVSDMPTLPRRSYAGVSLAKCQHLYCVLLTRPGVGCSPHQYHCFSSVHP